MFQCTRLLLALIVFLLGTTFAHAAAAATRVSPRRRRAAASATFVGPAAPVLLVGDGRSALRIVVRSANSPAVTFAAGELARYVEQITGAALPTGDDGKPGPRVVLGLRRDLSAADRKLLPKPAKGWDGYSIAVTDASDGARIVIGGDEPRGVVYGVYDLLERFGCNFAHPALDPADPETVPHLTSLTLPVGSWAVASPMKYRTLAWFVWRAKDPHDLATTPEKLAAQIDWAMKARYNVFESAVIELPPAHPLATALHAAKQRGMLLQAPGHNFDLFLPSDTKTFAEHPEWFGMRNGQRVLHQTFGAQFCWTNHGAQQRFIENVVAFVRARPDLDILELSGMDGGIQVPPCSCDVCSRRSPMDNALALMNAVVARLAKVAPHVVVETLGDYQYGEKLPKDVKPDRRLRVLWAHWGRSVSANYGSKDYPRRQRLQDWAHAFDGRMTVFQYYSDFFANSWLTSPLAEQIAGDRRFLIDLGIDGMLNLVFPEGHWWRSSLNAYLAGRSFYDATLDPYVLLREYALAYYGPAGEPMAAYLDEWARNVELGARSRDSALPQHLDLLDKERHRFLEPAAALAANASPFAERVAKTERVHHLAELIMAADIKRRALNDAIKAVKRDKASRQLDQFRGSLDAATSLAKTLADEDDGLVDRGISMSVFGAKELAYEKAEKAIADMPAPVLLSPSGAGSAPSALPQ